MKKRLAGIADYVGKDVVLSIDRKPIDDLVIDGFLVGISDSLLLLQTVHDGSMRLNGYTAIRLADIRSYQVDKSFVSRALRLLGRSPVIPDRIDITSWENLLASALSRYPLVMIEKEKKEPGCCWVGRGVKQTKKFIELRKISTDAAWEPAERFAYRDITQVSFDSGYIRALSFVVTEEVAARVLTQPEPPPAP